MLAGSDPSPAGPGASTQVSSQPRRQPWGLGIDAWSLEKYKGTSAEGMGLRAKAGSRAWKLCQGVQEEASRDGTMSRMGQGGEQGVEAESGGALMMITKVQSISILVNTLQFVSKRNLNSS